MRFDYERIERTGKQMVECLKSTNVHNTTILFDIVLNSPEILSYNDLVQCKKALQLYKELLWDMKSKVGYNNFSTYDQLTILSIIDSELEHAFKND